MVRTLFHAWWLVFWTNQAKWIAVGLALLSMYQTWDRQIPGMIDWPKLSRDLASAQTLTSITFIGVGAWQGATARRRRDHDVAAIASHWSAHHLLNLWSSVALWGLVSYLASVVGSALLVLPSHPWGSPDASLILAAACSVLAATSLGFCLGSWLPFRFLAPLLAFAWWLLDGLVALQDGAVKYLVPRALYEHVVSNIFYFPSPADVAPRQIALWVGLTVGAMLVTLTTMPGRALYRTVLVGFALALVGAPTIALLTLPPRPPIADATTRPYEEVCERASLVVCVHPAHAELLAGSTATVTAVLAPLTALDGIPHEAHEWGPGTSDAAGRIVFSLQDASSAQAPLAEVIALQLVTGRRDVFARQLTWSQAVVATWLMEAAGFVPQFGHYGWLTEEIRDAYASGPDEGEQSEKISLEDVATFASMDAATRTAWLQDHWDDLQQGQLPPSELP